MLKQLQMGIRAFLLLASKIWNFICFIVLKQFRTKITQQGGVVSQVAQVNNHLAVHLHRLFAEEKQNVFFSPFTISSAMATLLCAAEGETASEMRSALCYDRAGIKKEDIASIFEQQMSILLKNPGSYTLSCANSMLSQKGFDVKDEYKKILAESFKALLLEVDFQKDNEKVVNQINEWVKEKTNNMIPELVKSLDSVTTFPLVLVLLNAVYFKGTWMKKFERRTTFPQRFYNNGIEDNAKEIDMMHMTKSFPFYEDQTFQALQLPYAGEEVAMLILLPRSKNGLDSVEASLSSSFVQDLKKKLRKKKVEVCLPRFELKCTKALVPCFQKLGIGRVFRLGAELGVASDSPYLAVSEIIHKGVLVVNEDGSEAAAATVGMVGGGFMVNDILFVADHPFAFIIYDTTSDLILFMGRVKEL